MDGHPWSGLIVLLLLLIVNALVAAAEEAFGNVSESGVEHRAAQGDAKAVRLKKLLDTPHYYRNVIEITVTAASLLAGMLYSFTLYRAVQTLLRRQLAGEEELSALPMTLLMAAVTIFLLYLMVLFGILIPKKVAKRIGERTAYRMAPVIMVLYRLLSPFVFLLEKNSNFLLWLVGFRKAANEDNVTEEEIISMVNEGHEQGVLEANEAEMISNIIEFDEKEAKDVMTHRTKLVAIKSDMSIEEALNFMLDESFSRFPLYGENVDDIVGVLHLKDVMAWYRDPQRRERPLVEAAREPYFVPDTQSLDVLFHDMQTKKIHIAIVADEYGQTSGIVTMEDILEEIVGDIQDEYDEEEELISQSGEDSFIVSGEISLDELADGTGIHIREADGEAFDTLNGLLVSILDHIPQDDEKFEADYEGFHFEAVEIHDKMILRVKVTKLPQSDEEGEAGQAGEEEQTDH
ncbi:MAG: hemolysin family protein [Lachnospiraceae bacterium]|nr:hemolysin family protein [Lachnospiraceae bacterium]